MDKDTQPLCQVKSHSSMDTIYTTTPAPKVQGPLWKGVQIKEELEDQDTSYKLVSSIYHRELYPENYNNMIT